MEWRYIFNFYDGQCIIRHKKRNMPPILAFMVGWRMFPVNILDFSRFAMM